MSQDGTPSAFRLRADITPEEFVAAVRAIGRYADWKAEERMAKDPAVAALFEPVPEEMGDLRAALGTEQSMHQAWRKRAEQAERERDSLMRYVPPGFDWAKWQAAQEAACEAIVKEVQRREGAATPAPEVRAEEPSTWAKLSLVQLRNQVARLERIVAAQERVIEEMTKAAMQARQDWIADHRGLRVGDGLASLASGLRYYSGLDQAREALKHAKEAP